MTTWNGSPRSGSPYYAVAELVWNAVDADADRMDVTLQ